MLTIEYAKNPVWQNAEHNSIFLIVKFEEMLEELPFGATPFDPMPYGVELFNNAVAGQYGEISEYVPNAYTPAENQPVTEGTQPA